MQSIKTASSGPAKWPEDPYASGSRPRSTRQECHGSVAHCPPNVLPFSGGAERTRNRTMAARSRGRSPRLRGTSRPPSGPHRRRPLQRLVGQRRAAIGLSHRSTQFEAPERSLHQSDHLQAALAVALQPSADLTVLLRDLVDPMSLALPANWTRATIERGRQMEPTSDRWAYRSPCDGVPPQRCRSPGTWGQGSTFSPGGWGQ